MTQDLVQLNIDETFARIILGMGITGSVKFYIMNNKINEFIELSSGQLEKIQNAHPGKVQIYLEEFKPVIFNRGLRNGAHSQQIHYLNLWLDKTKFDDIQQTLTIKDDKREKCIEDIDLSKSPAFNQFTNMIKKAVALYPDWKKSILQKKIKKTTILNGWLKETTGANTREAELIKKVMSDFFEELQ